jgi:ABC-2 type transport system permease protein
MTRPLYWSVRRELWENRSVVLAPLAIAGLVLFSTLINAMILPQRMRGISALDPAKQRHLVVTPYGIAASVILFTGFVVGAFYCIDALNSERRDRSILFWNRTTVLAKASIPLALLPLFSFGLVLVSQTIMVVLSSVALLGSGLNPAMLWTRLPLLPMTLVMFYGLAVHVLWFAPLYAWLLLVSAWARRAAYLWAILPLIAVQIVERIAFGSTLVASLLQYRLIGAMREAFAVDPMKVRITRFSQLAPLRFLTSPGLWLGLLVAAAFLAAAVRLRRNREPI